MFYVDYCACFVVVALTLFWTVSKYFFKVCLDCCLRSVVSLLSFPFSLSVSIFYLTYSFVCTSKNAHVDGFKWFMHACSYVFMYVCLSVGLCMYLAIQATSTANLRVLREIICFAISNCECEF